MEVQEVNQQLLEKSEYHFLALVDVDFAAFHTFHPLSCKSIVGSIALHLVIRNRGELDASGRTFARRDDVGIVVVALHEMKVYHGTDLCRGLS